jgi:site-specific DNA-methyltransferase (cytosine-N4-specific)
MDPFCGGGTTLAEAQRRGHQTLGVDLNPIACLIARVKTAPLPTGALESAAAVLRQVDQKREVDIPVIPNLGHWFKPTIQQALTRLTQAIDGAPEEHRDFLRLAASSIIVRVSNQESDTRYAAIDKNIGALDVREAFRRASEKLFDALSARDYPLIPATIIEGNLLQLDLAAFEQRVGLIVTSPPYPNAYEYWLYHKYRMWWLGHDPLAVKEAEIGACIAACKKDPLSGVIGA